MSGTTHPLRTVPTHRYDGTIGAIFSGIITRESTRRTKPTKNKTEQPARQNSVRKQATSKQKQNSSPISQPSGYVNGHGYVDLGLSVKWATCNVGASSPSDYGGYYAWGETSIKSSYDRENCFDCVNPSEIYNDSGWGTYKIGGQTRITPTSGRDTARENWGSTWRMPTDAENEELCEKCNWKWTSKNGHKGYIVIGPNGNSIFLPAAGQRDGTRSEDVGTYGNYWSSTLSDYSTYACFLHIYSRYYHGTSGSFRTLGLSVRPVTE